MSDIEDYIKDHYGSCARGTNCYWERDGLGDGCLKRSWLGRLCKHWRPTQASSCEELRVEMLALYGCELGHSAPPTGTSDQKTHTSDTYDSPAIDSKSGQGQP